MVSPPLDVVYLEPVAIEAEKGRPKEAPSIFHEKVFESLASKMGTMNQNLAILSKEVENIKSLLMEIHQLVRL